VQRKDPQWVAAQFARSDTLLVPVWRNRNLVTGLQSDASSPTAVAHSRTLGVALIAAAAEPVFLGLRDALATFALDISACEEAHAEHLGAGDQFVDLRVAGPLLNAGDAALCAYARGITYWHRHNGFCNECGQATRSEQGGHVRKCSACEHVMFPRTDPAVIMLVVAESDSGPDLCLLGRDPRWPPGTYSTLAGFVEPGESLEEAVTREVFEETGVRVHEVTYMASQPWPFPASIMLGFRARAHTTALQLDAEEVEDARWFSAAEIETFGEWGDSGASLKVPRRDSIARYLVDTWVAEQKGHEQRT
jgi:NAD+ diphosphatase